MQNLIRLVKSNSDNNLILLKALIELKQKVEELEKIPDSEKLSQYVQLALTKYVMGHKRKRGC